MPGRARRPSRQFPLRKSGHVRIDGDVSRGDDGLARDARVVDGLVDHDEDVPRNRNAPCGDGEHGGRARGSHIVFDGEGVDREGLGSTLRPWYGIEGPLADTWRGADVGEDGGRKNRNRGGDARGDGAAGDRDEVRMAMLPATDTVDPALVSMLPAMASA